MEKKLKNKILIAIITFIFTIIITNNAYADIEIKKVEYTDEYKAYLELSEEEKSKVIAPSMFEINYSNVEVKNPFKYAKMLKNGMDDNYNLKNDIEENIVIKDQANTNSCWTFGTLSALETNLALRNKSLGFETKAYDFSERHMEYATTRNFANEEINEKGFNRNVGDGGHRGIAIPYLTNGIGAIGEDQMPFENNEDVISLANIQNKTVTSKVNDVIYFPTNLSNEEIKTMIKQHIKSYGAIEVGIHGASPISLEECYNNETGAIYCNDTTKYPLDHSVAIVGWDDTYEVSNFNENCKPSNSGAWIIKNSWGTVIEYSVNEIKEMFFNAYEEECEAQGYYKAEDIPEDIVNAIIQDYIEHGFTYDDENEKLTLKVGDNGFMYVSYEDVNIYREMTGIIKAYDKVDYENIYQYNEYGWSYGFTFNNNKFYLASQFDKKTSGDEYITEISLEAPERYTCKVYVNPDGTSKAKEDLTLVNLKAGETETIEAGYHTLEFENPVKINGNNFVVLVEIQSENGTVLTEANVGDIYSNVTNQTEKCFGTIDLESDEWIDISQFVLQGDTISCGDLTIKAFTVSEIESSDPETEDPETEDPGTENPGTEDPGTENPGTEDPGTENPGTENPGTENPGTENPEVEPKNSNFNNVRATITSLKVSTNSDDIIEIEVSGIDFNNVNDKCEYYYYLSPNKSESDIKDWVKIEDIKKVDGKLIFKINSKDLKNYAEISNEDTLYMYIKEIAFKGDKQSTVITKGISIELTGSEPISVDDKVVAKDKTVAEKELPNTGKIILTISIVGLVLLGSIQFIKYRRYKDIK